MKLGRAVDFCQQGGSPCNISSKALSDLLCVNDILECYYAKLIYLEVLNHNVLDCF